MLWLSPTGYVLASFVNSLGLVRNGTTDAARAARAHSALCRLMCALGTSEPESQRAYGTAISCLLKASLFTAAEAEQGQCTAYFNTFSARDARGLDAALLLRDNEQVAALRRNCTRPSRRPSPTLPCNRQVDDHTPKDVGLRASGAHVALERPWFLSMGIGCNILYCAQ